MLDLLLELLQVIHDGANGAELGGIVIIDGDAEAVLQGHDEFHHVQGIGAQVIHNIGLGGNGLGIDLELLCQIVPYGFKKHGYFLPMINQAHSRLFGLLSGCSGFT